MARSFTATNLVTLPRLSGVTAARLLTQLLTAAAHEKKLPATISAARDALIPARDTLEGEIGKRVSGAGEETPVVRAADRVEDNGFGALVDWLQSFARLPAERHPEAITAQAVLYGVFKDGLSFLRLAPVNEWQEAEVRLALLRDQGHREAISKMGGKAFLDELDFAHKAYGLAVGTTGVKPALESPAMRIALDNARHDLRAYILAVSSHVKRQEPATQALADRLLAPLVSWKDNASRSAPVISPEGSSKSTGESGPALDMPVGK